jgi:hypothetical protein
VILKNDMYGKYASFAPAGTYTVSILLQLANGLVPLSKCGGVNVLKCNCAILVSFAKAKSFISVIFCEKYTFLIFAFPANDSTSMVVHNELELNMTLNSLVVGNSFSLKTAGLI